MDVFEINIETLFKSYKLRIPLYQRYYLWKEEEVHTFLNEVLDFSSSVNSGQQDRFIGTISLKRAENDVYEILDGQQRIITVQLALCVLFDFTQLFIDEITDKLSSFPGIHKNRMKRDIYKILNRMGDVLDNPITREGQQIGTDYDYDMLHESFGFFPISLNFEDIELLTQKQDLWNNRVECFANYFHNSYVDDLGLSRNTRLSVLKDDERNFYKNYICIAERIIQEMTKIDTKVEKNIRNQLAQTILGKADLFSEISQAILEANQESDRLIKHNIIINAIDDSYYAINDQGKSIIEDIITMHKIVMIKNKVKLLNDLMTAFVETTFICKLTEDLNDSTYRINKVC